MQMENEKDKKTEFKTWLKIAFVMLSFTLAFVLLNYFLKQNSHNRDDIKLKELQQLASETPIYPKFTLVDTNYGSKSVNAGVHNHYKSVASYEEVKSFYVSELSKRGWSLSEDGKQLIFKKQGLIIALEYSGEQVIQDGWNYSVSYVWRDGQ